MIMLLLLSIAISTATGAPEWTNITVYRTTPINYTGITNMDSGDAAGDVLFGLTQLLLPVLCPQNPDFTWCANMHYLSGGDAHMVYSEFTIATDPRFGDYAACNPNASTGIFQCEHYDSGSNASSVPTQCSKGFEMYHRDCLNGTIYKVLPTADEGACCAACTVSVQSALNRSIPSCCAGLCYSLIGKGPTVLAYYTSHMCHRPMGTSVTVGICLIGTMLGANFSQVLM
jgi:hypothetical protein